MINTYVDSDATKSMFNLLPQAPHTSIPAPRVLVVDDDLAMRSILCQLMEQEGFQVLMAENGFEALAQFNDHPPDLVLMDAMMPSMDGFTCCAQMQQLFPIPVLIITNLDDPDSVRRAFEVGAIDYVTKPINQVVLRQRVHRLIQQSRLLQQVQSLNEQLETYMLSLNLTIRERTVKLQQSLEFESTLKHITDRVRDSLDEQTILQTVVQEVTWALELGCCNAAIYDMGKRISQVSCEYSTSIPGYQNRTLFMTDYPALYDQLLQGEPVQFCSRSSQSWRGEVALFAFPIQDGDNVLGDIWLVSAADRQLNDLELRLIQQVTNQCAIAIRQARLYQAAQVQVQELAHLNQLKDDFLSTVSHELRTPVTNMRMAIQLSEQSMRMIQSDQELNPNWSEWLANVGKIDTYLQILHSECDREINLINDLLDLQRLEAGQQILNPVVLYLSAWLPPLIKSFQVRAQLRQQTVQINLAEVLPPLYIDPFYLQRILTELLNNACKYSPAAATITLSATFSLTTLCLQVTNTDITIPAAELEHIFDKFYRVPGGDRWHQGGTGLGLALVKQLVKLFDGTIQATSGVNETCFLVELPLTPLSPPDHLPLT